MEIAIKNRLTNLQKVRFAMVVMLLSWFELLLLLDLQLVQSGTERTSHEQDRW